MSEDERIEVEDLEGAEASEKSEQKREWSEEMKVSGEELVGTVRRLVKEANVRRIVVKSSEGKTLIEIPLALGLAGIALLPVYSALALMAALLTECTIVVEHTEKAESAEKAA